MKGETESIQNLGRFVGPQGYPNIFRSDGSSPCLIILAFRYGKAYDSLRTMEVTGRDCCHNPVEYEIWGIADIAQCQLSVPATMQGWKDDALAKALDPPERSEPV